MINYLCNSSLATVNSVDCKYTEKLLLIDTKIYFLVNTEKMPKKIHHRKVYIILAVLENGCLVGHMYIVQCQELNHNIPNYLLVVVIYIFPF